MDYSSALNEPRTNAEQNETGDEFRGSFESDEWADLTEGRVERGRRLPYHLPQIVPNERYSGVLDCMEVGEARALLCELLDRFRIHDWEGFTLPPTGLPGFRADGFHADAPAAQLIDIGVQYTLSMIRGEPRAMHLRWQDAEALIKQAESDGEQRVWAQKAREAVADMDARDATPQFVYFIGAQSGPIKIGLATRPRDRLKTLQTSHHERLEIMAVRSGRMDVERAYHRQFAAHRLHGEWFERVPAIEAEIERLNADRNTQDEKGLGG